MSLPPDNAGSERKIRVCPDFESDEFAESKKIENVLHALPDLSTEDMADFCIKMNQAIATGALVLKPTQVSSLKLLSTKFIPDAPRQINIDAHVKTETVILGWLETNSSLQDAAEERAALQENSEEASYEEIPEFLEGEAKPIKKDAPFNE